MRFQSFNADTSSYNRLGFSVIITQSDKLTCNSHVTANLQIDGSLVRSFQRQVPSDRAVRYLQCRKSGNCQKRKFIFIRMSIYHRVCVSFYYRLRKLGADHVISLQDKCHSSGTTAFSF